MNGRVELSTPLSSLAFCELMPGRTILEHFEHNAPSNRPVICILNGQPLLRRDWGRQLKEDDCLQFMIIPQGGGIKGIIAVVASLALAVSAPILAPIVGGIIGITSALGISLISAGLVIGGGFLINALLPPRNGGESAKQSFGASPTYSLAARGNTARLLEPIPRQYGRHILYPDFASMPWITYEGNDQFLYQLFCLGVGHYNVEEVRIGSTKLWDNVNGVSSAFSDVQVQIINPGAPITLFPAAVITSIEVGGQEALCVDGSRTVTFSGSRMTMTTVGQVEKLDFVAVGDTLEISGASVNNGTYTVTNTSGDGEWVEVTPAFTAGTGISCTVKTVAWIGPFPANPADRNTDKIQVDLVCSRGVYYANNEGGLTAFSISVSVEARPINSAGAPTGGWFSLDNNYTITRTTATPQRITRTYTVSLGRYEVRLRRTSDKKAESRYANDVVWAAMRAFIPDDNTFADVTLMAVAMKASNQLTDQASRSFNVIQTAKLPVWNGTSWSAPQVTRSIAWAAADMLRNQVYGAGLPDSRIDLEALLALDSIWTSRGDKFDGIFDRKQTLWDSLAQVLTAGRTQPLLLAGRVTFVRDMAQSVVRCLFTPRNTIAGTFEVTHVLYDEDSPDAIIVEFMDERTWRMNEVVCKLPGSTEDNPARIQVFGVVTRTQAWREGIYQAAVNAYRRTFGVLSAEMEGRMLVRGDAIAVSHDMMDWGISAEVTSWNRSTFTLGLNEPFDSSCTVVGISDRRGRMVGPIAIAAVTNGGLSIVLDTSSLLAVEATLGHQIEVNTDFSSELTRVAGGSSVNYSKRFKLVSARPEKSGTAQLVLTVDDPRVYTADVGSPPAEGSFYGPGTSPDAPTLTGLVVNKDPSSPANPVLLNVAWAASPGASSYIIQTSPDGISWTTNFEGTATFRQISVEAGTVYLRVAAVGVLRGPWAYPTPNPATYGTATLVPGQPQNLTAAVDTGGGTITSSWSAAPRASLYKVEIFSSSLLKIVRYTSTTALLITPSEIAAAGGPWSSISVVVTGQNGIGDGPSATFNVSGVTMSAPASVYLVTTYNGNDINAQWPSVASATSYIVELWQGGVLKATFNTTSTSVVIPSASIISAGGPWRSLELRVKATNGSLTSSATVLSITDVAPSVPTTINTSSPAAGQVDVNWSASSGAIRYALYRATSAGFTPSVGNRVYLGSALSQSFTGLVSGTTYYFRLQPEDDYAGGDGYNISTEFSRLCS